MIQPLELKRREETLYAPGENDRPSLTGMWGEERPEVWGK